ncbi:hypothetical protein AXF42_Ash011509 [Apostasia shenzhenica]|uniref:Uncharacterized protein n=1 Tax=Apostasia shenzhenica TaxID=1088818 RepID=A0A2I0BAT5_9ASPA|nr:hypothetical protein AXF42_Ash011509 [Apostasia shenzhenica]
MSLSIKSLGTGRRHSWQRPTPQAERRTSPSSFCFRLRRIADPHQLPSKQFQALFDSLFKVLFIFSSRYLFAIGLSSVFSLGQNLPPDLGCIPKQPDLVIPPRIAAGCRMYGALTLPGAPFQGTWVHFIIEVASLDYNLGYQLARFSHGAHPGLLTITRGILVFVRLLGLQAIARENLKNTVGRVQRWQCADPKNVGECRSVRMRDWCWDDLWEERSPIPPTTVLFESALHSLKHGMVCRDSAILKAFGVPRSFRGRVSLLGAPILPVLHPAGCAVGYLMVAPNKCKVPAGVLRLQATARENCDNAVV